MPDLKLTRDQLQFRVRYPHVAAAMLTAAGWTCVRYAGGGTWYPPFGGFAVTASRAWRLELNREKLGLGDMGRTW